MRAPEYLPRTGRSMPGDNASPHDGSETKTLGTLVVMLRGTIVNRVPLTQTRMLIGRGAQADLRLNSRFVSINHCMIVRDDTTAYIVDLHSTNQTIVNGRSVSEQPLHDSDVICIGDHVLHYRSGPLSLLKNGVVKQTETSASPQIAPPAKSPLVIDVGASSVRNPSLEVADERAPADPADREEAAAEIGMAESGDDDLDVPDTACELAAPVPESEEMAEAEDGLTENAPMQQDDPLDALVTEFMPASPAPVSEEMAEPEDVVTNDILTEDDDVFDALLAEYVSGSSAPMPSSMPEPEDLLPESAVTDADDDVVEVCASEIAQASQGLPERPTASPAEIIDLAGVLEPSIDDTALAVAVTEAAREGRSPLEVLETTSGLDAEVLATELARVFAYRHLPARELMALDADFEILPAAEARRRGCAIVQEAGRMTAVIADPFDADLRPWLEARVTSPLRWALTARGDLNAFISRHEQGMRAIDTALKGAHGALAADNDLEDLSLASINRDSSPVVKLVRSTLYDALRANASDVHLEAGNAQLEIRYRIDGVLVQVASVPGSEVAEQVISRIKVMSELDIAERRVPQDGRFKSTFNGRAIDFRVSIMPSTFGEDAVLRVLDKQAITDQMSELRIDGLGFDPAIVESLRQLSELPYGMLLVTGPTGSGKTTTLYAAISETNTGMGKIVTIEDPVEYQLPGVLQIPVNEKKGLTFARGLRSILRHDPDKIMVGEIRDPETAQIAVQSALTGHLVFTTVHANNVFDVLGRFTHMGVDVHSFVAALNGILAQRLLRIVCSECSEPAEMSLEMLEAAGLSREETRDFNWHAGRGCSHCRGTGYHGRRAVGELMVLNDELREAIVARVPVRQLKELAHKHHVRLIRSVALDLVRDGLTTLEEVNRVTAVS